MITVKELEEQIKFLKESYSDLDVENMEVHIELSETYWGSFETDYYNGYLVNASITNLTQIVKDGVAEYIEPPILMIYGYVE